MDREGGGGVRERCTALDFCRLPYHSNTCCGLCDEPMNLDHVHCAGVGHEAGCYLVNAIAECYVEAAQRPGPAERT